MSSRANAQITFVDEATGKSTAATGALGRSLLHTALETGIPLEHTCGGVCACSTCHVRILHGAEHLTQPDDRELDQVEQAPDYGPDSRLACQAIITTAGQIRCLIPRWNRNAVKEGR